MPATDPGSVNLWRKHAASVTLLIGVTAIAASFALPSLSIRRSLWSDEQARQYQAVSAKLHALAHQHGENAQPTKAHSNTSDLQEAQAKYDELRQQLDTARAFPGRTSAAMFGGGILLSAIGTLIYLAGSHE
jgi:hypothetical protein